MLYRRRDATVLLVADTENRPEVIKFSSVRLDRWRGRRLTLQFPEQSCVLTVRFPSDVRDVLP